MLLGANFLRELDLHGMKTADAISFFTREYENALESGTSCFKVIHGYGSGGIGGDTRRSIRSLLAANPACADFVAGEDVDGNPGYTVVYPKRRLPSGSVGLYDSIVEFCSSPKTKSAVTRRFVRRTSEGEIHRALRNLENRRRLRTFYRNGRKHYVDSRVGRRRI
jgi:hypothetical protein